MQECNVKFPEDTILPKTSEDLLQLMQQLFDPLPAFQPLASAIQYENKPKFGPSAISNIRFNVISFDATTFKGRLRVLYDMQLTFGCEDFIKDHLNQHSYYNFNFLASQSLLHLESDALEAPSTKDEF